MDIVRFIATPFTRRLERFRNRHLGESCYVFGDGPSIKWFDLSAFSDRPVICCGMIPFHRDFYRLNAQYVMLVEPWLFAPRVLRPRVLHELGTIATTYKRFATHSLSREFFVSLSNLPFISGRNINYVYRGFPQPMNPTDKLLAHYDLFSGSFHASLALAYYLGFKTIHLVGFDAWTIQPARTLRWYELGEGKFFEPTDFATDFLEILKSEVDIYTISYDGQSKNVRNVNYKTYTGKAPIYRENYELLDENSLKMLATCPEYSIFPK